MASSVVSLEDLLAQGSKVLEGPTNVDAVEQLISSLQSAVWLSSDAGQQLARDDLLQRAIAAKTSASSSSSTVAAASEGAKDSADYDLTYQIGAFLDLHLLLQLLEFLEVKELYPKRDILEAKLGLLAKTDMLTYAIEIYEKNDELAGDAADKERKLSELKQRRDAVLVKFEEEASNPIVLAVRGQTADGVSVLVQLEAQNSFNMAYLTEHFGATEDSLLSLYRFAKFRFGCGLYTDALSYLSAFRRLSNDAELCFSALWGQLACEILTQDWDSALENLHLLKDAIESRPGVSPTTLLRQRVWLMHWSLFFFGQPAARASIIDLFFQEKYLNAIQIAAPHLLRYLATAVVTNKRRRLVLNDLVAVLKAESHSYSDPITEFVECLYVKFDFDTAQQKLIKCDTVMTNDIFLESCRDEFVENARLFIFETYCRIHSCIDLSMLSEKLNMDPEDAERWIVNLIRNAKIDAKIDSAANQVVMGNPSISIYQRVIENTRILCTRTHNTYQALSTPQLS